MKNYLIILLLVLFNSYGCEEQQPSPVQLNKVIDINLTDHGNLESSADIFLKFQSPLDRTGIKEYRIIITKLGSNESLAELLSLPSSSSITVESSINSYAQNLPPGILDSDGNAIRNGQSYAIKVLSVPIDETFDVTIARGPSLSLAHSSYYEVNTLTSATGEAMSYHPDGFLIFPRRKNVLTKVNINSPSGEIFDSGYSWALGGGFDLKRNIYYGCDYAGGRIYAYDLKGNKTVFASGMVGPIGIAVDDESNVYATNFDANTISKISPEGEVSEFARNPNLINGPDGLVFANGDLYSINFYDSRIYKINEAGEMTLFARLPGTTTGYIAYEDDYFYVASISARQIFKIDMQGNYSSIAGTGQEGSENGPATLASFKTPNGIAVSGDTIFVGDQDGIRMLIRKN